MNVKYSVKIDAFEGPLDLLLHLINRFEIDIYDIPVAEITDQYMGYIHAMQELELDIASEYLVMAATLLAMKSRMLLPKQEPAELDEEFYEEEGDPRDELINRLVEYRKFKEAAGVLKKREAERSLVYTKEHADFQEFAQEDAAPSSLDVNLYDMIGALQKMLKRKQAKKPPQTKINRQEIPIEARMDEIVSDLKNWKGRKSFTDLFPHDDREQIVVTFLAVLELLKMKKIHCEQDKNFSEIWVYGSRDEGKSTNE
ncbi:segregation/condensation protein A [Bacillus marinisedimentorum]|uniref:segregation/condensation protein A n=1 Tax=Bacillus marinisedimentorum TaxID=1821260 RepID=UPI0008724E7C|nr:segregation/condensation protein A [Bacillus marinisedimentorum]